MKKQAKKKLTLQRESLRQLETQALRGIGGGGGPIIKPKNENTTTEGPPFI